ncbi:hypothetical protein G647_06500 [Cladophialophora carrionii CBS 160.54]|uniref:non-specific serine/threonine protein kinase n=1 Tax=Cladophialophora carrionii CBS 160.54 TaxID=1279043 RepID=V9D6D6_9EURO|nr:uncharacterized protein G647_06500 [Cladophialophora carrionii CBS 160.54]ETI22425.1 hypothetical protein G647_06500 [Cladophialophora carrionii CBS 160.54]
MADILQNQSAFGNSADRSLEILLAPYLTSTSASQARLSEAELIPRGKTFKKNTEVLKGFERELTHLKKLSHIHIVELIRSHADTKFVGILMPPVADYNLKDFLMRRNLMPGQRSFLRTFFGCLVAALCYLHENKIRHKDIKPQNVLVKGHQVFLTDFGISLDWPELDQSTTTGVTTKTPRYCAPEVAGFQPRTSLSDMWSLGCVFLEIWTVLKRETLDALSGYLEKHGTQSTCYWLNYESSHEWCTLLERNVDHDDHPPAVWIRSLLQPDQEDRWTAQQLVNGIQHTNDRADLRFAFAGTCCDGAEGSSSSGRSSKRSSALLEETGASSVGIYDPSSGKGKQEEDTEVPTHHLPSSLTKPRPSMAPPVQGARNTGGELAESSVSGSLLSPKQQVERLSDPRAQPSAPAEDLVQNGSAAAVCKDARGHQEGQFVSSFCFVLSQRACQKRDTNFNGSSVRC